MTLQQRTSGIMVIVSIFVLGANLLRPIDIDHLVSIIMSAVAFIICALCFFIESTAMKWIQSVFSLSVGMASIMMSPNGYLSFGFLPMFIAYALWYGYGFYHKWPKVMAIITIITLLTTSFSAYLDLQRSAVLMFAITASFIIIAMALTHRAQQEHEFATKAMVANKKAMQTINLMERKLYHESPKS